MRFFFGRLTPCLTVANPSVELQTAAKAIIARAVVREVQNPGGFARECIGEYEYARDQPGGELFTAGERDQLAALCPVLKPGTGAYSVPLAGPGTAMGWGAW